MFAPNIKYFEPHEFDQPGAPGSGESMDPHFIEMLDILRESVGAPFVIHSGIRSATYNQQISNTGPKGPHTTGKAADIRCSDPVFAYSVIKHALSFKGVDGHIFSGIGIAKGFIHLDILTKEEGFPRPWVWSYETSTQETTPLGFNCSGTAAYSLLADKIKDPAINRIVLQQHSKDKTRRYIGAEVDGKPGIFVGL